MLLSAQSAVITNPTSPKERVSRVSDARNDSVGFK